jgi:hypothetical protein
MAGLGEAMWRAGAPPRGEQILRAVVAAYPDAQAGLRADARARLAELLLEGKRDPAEAATLAKDALATRGERAGLLELVGRACDAAQDRACANDAWRRLAALPRAPAALRAAAEARLAAPTPAAGGDR